MRIAVFDENYCDSAYLKHLIYIFSNNKKFDLVVDVFSDINEFLKTKREYILYFISFETKNGILAAKNLYNKNKNSSIIITANDSRLAVEAFKINAYNFLQLPLKEKILYEILNDFFRSYQCEALLISDGFENIYINVKDILYLEADNKHCVLHLKNQKVYCNKTMARVYNVLPKECFLKTSRAFVVNANHVSRFNSEHIILENGDTLYPSRHFYKSFKCDFLRTSNLRIP